MNERKEEQSAVVAITYEYIPYTKYTARLSESHNLLARRRWLLGLRDLCPYWLERLQPYIGALQI